MSDEFTIDVQWLNSSDPEPTERYTFAEIVISAAGQFVTELEDLFARTVRPGLRAPAYDLAMWLAENWWRLRWEPEGNSIDWRLSHTIAAIGGGVAWPDISFASDGVHILIEARRTAASGKAPVRYIHDADVQVSAQAFETGINQFIECILARLSSVGVGDTDLGVLWQELSKERTDKALTAIRRTEALMGFDPDEAPEHLIADLQTKAAEAGRDAIDEIAAAAKKHASNTVNVILDQVRDSKLAIHVESASDVFKAYSRYPSEHELPWQRASRAAKLARDVWGIPNGRVSNEKLSEILNVPKDALGYTASNGLSIGAGFRIKPDADDISVVMRAKVETGRRFEIMRLVADHIAASWDDRLLPITRAKTDRQKFQRAFAQEFLLPFDELHERLGRPLVGEYDISDDDIEDVAHDYDVSPLCVRTALVNRGYLPREALIAA